MKRRNLIVLILFQSLLGCRAAADLALPLLALLFGGFQSLLGCRAAADMRAIWIIVISLLVRFNPS